MKIMDWMLSNLFPNRLEPIHVHRRDPDLVEAQERMDRLIARARSLGIDGDVTKAREQGRMDSEGGIRS